MTMNEIRTLIDEMGGKRDGGINWEWATFENEEKGLECFNLVKDHCEHRGFDKAWCDSSNSVVIEAGFRFR